MSVKMVTPKQHPGFTPTHDALSLLAQADREAGARLLNGLGIPINPTSLKRILFRLAKASELAPLFWIYTGDLTDLISSWSSLANQVSHDHRLAGHYLDPIERNRSESNPARGYMADRPVFAALASPVFEADAELTYCTILAGPTGSLLSRIPLGPPTQSAFRLAELARRVFQSITNDRSHLAGWLDISSVSPPIGTPEQRAATVWLRLSDLKNRSDITPSSHELIVAWASFLRLAGGTGTGFKVAGQRPVSPDDLNDGGHRQGKLLIPQTTAVEADGEPVNGVLLIGPDADVGAGVPTDNEAQRDAIHAWTARTRSEFILPGSWDRFLDGELELLLDALNDASTTPGNAIIRAGLCCGLRPRAIAGALDGKPFHDGSTPFGVNRVGLAPSISRTLSARELPKSFRPGTTEGATLYQSAGSVICITSALIPGPIEGTFDAALDLAYVRIRRDERIRLTDGRIARQLVCEFVRESQDPYLADLVMQPKTASILSGAGYYIGALGTKAAKQLSFVARQGGSLIATDGLLGSHGVPRLDVIKGSFKDLNTRAAIALSAAQSPEGLVAAHNAYVLWTLSVLSLGSSHRLVQDPFPSRTCHVPERSLFIIQDKVGDASHEARLAVASNTCKVQWELYIQHLRALSDRLTFHGSPDAARVRALSTGASSAAPFLFFLTEEMAVTSITPRAFHKQMGDCWPWHDSYHRHLLSWWLREQGAPPELIHAHLGHWVAGRAPFSEDSFLAPHEMINALAGHIDRLLETLAIAPMRGLRAAGVYGRKREDVVRFRPWGLLGPELRAQRREQAAARHPDYFAQAREALSAAAWSFGVSSLTQKAIVPKDAVSQAREALVGRYAEDPAALAIALRALRTHCQALRNQGTKILVPGAPYRPGSSTPLLKDPTGQSASLGILVRHAVATWLAENAPAANPDDYSAMAFLSAVTNGGLIDKRRWQSFATAIGNRHQCNGVDWLELADVGRQGDRYVGDAMTRGLLRQCSTEQGQSPGSLRKKAEGMLRDACARIPDELAELSEDRKDLGFHHLLDAIGDSLALDVSGVVIRHLRGDSRARTTSSNHLISLLSGTPRTFQTNDIAPPSETAPMPPVTRSEGILQNQLQLHLDALRRADADSATNHKQKDIGRRLQKRLDDLESDLNASLFDQRMHGSRPALFRLTQYALHLVRDGGIQRDRLRPSTIRKYAGTHVLEIVKAFWQQDPASLDDTERTNVYDVIFRMLGKSTEDFVDALRYFDWFICEAHDQTPADWRSLGYSAVPTTILPYCDFPTLPELAPLQLPWPDALDTGTNFDARKPVTLMAATGIRSGEAYRLTATDPVTSDVDALRISNKASGETKTRAGVRFAFRIPNLSSTDSTSMGGSGSSASVPADAPLFAAHEDRIPRHKFNAALKEALFTATGDRLVRPHLLRHGVASYLILAAGASGSAIGTRVLSSYAGVAAISDLRHQLTGRCHATALWSDAICETVGHSGIGTAFEHYGHMLDLVSAAQLDRWTAELPSRFESLVLGISVNALNQRVFRRNSAGLDVGLPWLLVSTVIPIRVDTRNAADRRSPESASDAPQQRGTGERHVLHPTEIGIALELLHQGSSETEIGQVLDLEPSDARDLVQAMDEVQMLIAPPVKWLEASRIEPGSLKKHIWRACTVLGNEDGTGFWDDPNANLKADVFLVAWRPARREFAIPSSTVQDVVMALLDKGAMPRPETAADTEVIRYPSASTETGTRLSHLLTLTYTLAIRQRFCPPTNGPTTK